MPDVWTVIPQDVIKLLLALLIGGVIGAEREFRDKAAGFRTIILICFGSALFTIFSLKLSGQRGDPARIAAQIVSGVGFLGAGVILHYGTEIRGITTASTIWLAAALGMGIGGGYLLFVSVATVLMLLVLLVFPWLESLINRARDTRTYRVVCPSDSETLARLENVFKQGHLRLRGHGLIKRGGEVECTWTAYGTPGRHAKVVQQLLADADVKEFQF